MDAGGFKYGKDDDGYIPTYNDLVTYSKIEDMLPSSPNKLPIAKKKKPRMKQMKMEKGMKNMKQKNFQGYDIERCKIVDGGLCIYLPKSYGGKSRKKYRNCQPPPTQNICCRKCFLLPCSMLEYHDDLLIDLKEQLKASEGTTSDANELIDIPKEKFIEKLKFRYRVLINKHVGKKFQLSFMSKNEKIPVCAREGIVKMVEDELGEEDSLEDSPFTHDAKLNKRDNQSEEMEFNQYWDSDNN